MGANAGRSGGTWRRLKAQLKADGQRRALVCWRCRQPIDYTISDPLDPESFTAGHILPRSTHPQLAEDPFNLAPEHRRCNLAAGNRMPRPALGATSRVW